MTRTNPEFLPNNFLDRHMHTFLRPLEFSLAIFFQSKFEISDNFITPNRFVISIVTFLLTIIIFSISFTFNILNFLHDFSWFNSIFITGLVISHFSYFFMVIIVVFINKFNSECSVKLVLHLQELIYDVKFSNFSVKDLAIGNWVTVGFVFATTIGPFIMMASSFGAGVFSLTGYFFSILDITMMYGSRMITLIKRCVDVWLEEIRTRSTTRLDDLQNDWATVQRAFYNLSEAYIAYQKLFFIPVSTSIFLLSLLKAT